MAWTSAEMYSHGLDLFSGVVASVDPAAWDRPSPCEGWTAADVLGHVGGATAMGARILRGGDMSFDRRDPPSSIIEGEPLTWWKDLSSEAREALAGVEDLDREVDTPMGRRSIREGLSFPAADLFLHGWDLAVATGQSVAFPDEAVEFVRAMFENVPEEITRRPGVFSPAVETPEGSNPTEALIAWSGRDPRWGAKD